MPSTCLRPRKHAPARLAWSLLGSARMTFIRVTTNVYRSQDPHLTAVRVRAEVAVRHRRVVIGMTWPQAAPPGGCRCWAELSIRQALPGGARDVGRDDIGHVPVQAATGPVIPHRGSRISMGGGLLDVAQRHSGIERCGNKCVPKGVRGDGFGDPGAASDLADEPPRAVPVQPPSVCGHEDRPVGALADG
jgi:hypothetical protein